MWTANTPITLASLTRYNAVSALPRFSGQSFFLPRLARNAVPAEPVRAKGFENKRVQGRRSGQIIKLLSYQKEVVGKRKRRKSKERRVKRKEPVRALTGGHAAMAGLESRRARAGMIIFAACFRGGKRRPLRCPNSPLARVWIRARPGAFKKAATKEK